MLLRRGRYLCAQCHRLAVTGAIVRVRAVLYGKGKRTANGDAES